MTIPMRNAKNPFLGVSGFGSVDAVSRLSDVKSFSPKQLCAALKVKGLQKTVKTAIESRLRKLAKGAKS